jgi:hypothetical protein
MNTKDLEKLMALKPCNEALEWAKTQPDLKTAWEKCEKLDWMFWYLRKVALMTTPWAKFGIECAAHVKHLNNRYSQKAYNAAATYAAYAAYAPAYAPAAAAYAPAYVATNAANAAYAAYAYAAERAWQRDKLLELTTSILTFDTTVSVTIA